MKLRIKTEVRHIHTRDEKARKSEHDNHGQWGKSTHFLETRGKKE
jgi:hypothetical protein